MTTADVLVWVLCPLALLAALALTIWAVRRIDRQDKP